MADTKTATKDPAVERREREDRETVLSAMQKEEDEGRAKDAAAKQQQAPAGVVLAATQDPAPEPQKARLVLKSDVVRKADERYQTYSVLIEGIDVSKGDAQKTIENLVLGDPTLLWPKHNVLQRHAVVVLHDSYFNWEVTARVKEINENLHLVQLVQIGPVLVHRLGKLAFDWSAIQIADRGTKGKWSVLYKGALLKDGFESREAAERHVQMQKIAA